MDAVYTKRTYQRCFLHFNKKGDCGTPEPRFHFFSIYILCRASTQRAANEGMASGRLPTCQSPIHIPLEELIFGYLKETSSEGRTIGLGSREKDKGLPEALIRANHMSPINVGVTRSPGRFPYIVQVF